METRLLEEFGDELYLQSKDDRWLSKKEEILKRDNYTCKMCGSMIEPDLDVYHTKYVFGRKLWEYDNTDLITLCPECKREASRNVYFQVKQIKLTPCFKCGGTGITADGLLCLRCMNYKYEEFFNQDQAYQYSEDRIAYPILLGEKLTDESLSERIGQKVHVASAKLIADTTRPYIELYLDGGQMLHAEVGQNLRIKLNKQFPVNNQEFELIVSTLYFFYNTKKNIIVITKASIV